MQGMCYSNQISSTKLDAELFEIENYGIYFSVVFDFSFSLAFSQIFLESFRIDLRYYIIIKYYIYIYFFKRY